MNQIYRPSDGTYFNSIGTGNTARYACFFNNVRAWNLVFPDLTTLFDVDNKSKIRISTATLYTYVLSAGVVGFNLGYNYSTNYTDRNSLLSSDSYSFTNTEGWQTFDITDILKDYCEDGQSGNAVIWGVGTSGTSSDKYFRGFNPDAQYTDQRPYILIEYGLSNFYIRTSNEWKACVPYVYLNGVWEPTTMQLRAGNEWK